MRAWSALVAWPCKKTLVDCVVHHLDAPVGNSEQLFDFVFGELRNREHPRCLAQHAPRQIKVHAARRPEVLRDPYMCSNRSCTSQYRAVQSAWNPEQMRDVNHVALQTAHDGAEIESSFERVIAPDQHFQVKVRRQGAKFRHLLRRSNEEIVAVVIQRASVRTTFGCRFQRRIPSFDGCRWLLSQSEFNHTDAAGHSENSHNKTLSFFGHSE